VRELGIRMALGAHPDSLVRLILAQGFGIAVVGVTVGIGIALSLGWVLRGLLYGVGQADPVALIVAATVLLLSAAAAAWVPARRASRIDSAISLRGR
jgi:ABC-type antimicrobial peptide transport system permease subunit